MDNAISGACRRGRFKQPPFFRLNCDDHRVACLPLLGGLGIFPVRRLSYPPGRSYTHAIEFLTNIPDISRYFSPSADTSLALNMTFVSRFPFGSTKGTIPLLPTLLPWKKQYLAML